MSDDAAAARALLGEVVELAKSAAPVKSAAPARVEPEGKLEGRDGARGLRFHLTTKFVEDLKAWHEKDGYKAIERVGRERPEILLQMIAGLVPREDRLDVGYSGAVAVGVIDLQEIKQRTRELFARLGDTVDPGLRED